MVNIFEQKRRFWVLCAILTASTPLNYCVSISVRFLSWSIKHEKCISIFCHHSHWSRYWQFSRFILYLYKKTRQIRKRCCTSNHYIWRINKAGKKSSSACLPSLILKKNLENFPMYMWRTNLKKYANLKNEILENYQLKHGFKDCRMTDWLLSMHLIAILQHYVLTYLHTHTQTW